MAGAYITTEAGERLLTEAEDFIVTEDFDLETDSDVGQGSGEDDVWIIFMLRSRRRERK